MSYPQFSYERFAGTVLAVFFRGVLLSFSLWFVSLLGSDIPLDVTALSDAPSARRWACQPCIYGAVCGGGRSILIGRRIALAGRRGRTHRQVILDRSVVDDAAVV